MHARGHRLDMAMTRFQKLATAALISVLFLMFVGAIVRVTGAGMGCPDWPKCWGSLIPPTAAEQVDFTKLPIERFRQKAERMGRDPSTITEESLRQEFNPRHVWTEYFNRLCSLPVGFFCVATVVAGFWQRPKRPLVFWCAWLALIMVLINAWMGARVVFSGLKPGVLTTHLALAMSLLGFLTYAAWAGTDRPWRIQVHERGRRLLRWAVIILLGTIIIEGILGSQVREQTDLLSKFHIKVPRAEWNEELEKTWSYLIHRSFSWGVLIAAIWAWWLTRKHVAGGPKRVERVVLGIVIAQMVLGIVMSQVHIYGWVQVLHVGLAAVLLTFCLLWLLGLTARREPTSDSKAAALR